jgi:hypothetical protein
MPTSKHSERFVLYIMGSFSWDESRIKNTTAIIIEVYPLPGGIESEYKSITKPDAITIRIVSIILSPMSKKSEDIITIAYTVRVVPKNI